MKYGMRERISGGVIIAAIAVILVLFFFGRPGHRSENATAPEVSFNQQPVASSAQNAATQAVKSPSPFSQAPDPSQLNGAMPAPIETAQNPSATSSAAQEHPPTLSPVPAVGAAPSAAVTPIQTQSFALAPASQHVAPVTSHGHSQAHAAAASAPASQHTASQHTASSHASASHAASKPAALKPAASESERKVGLASTPSNDPVIGAAAAHTGAAHPTAASKHSASTTHASAPAEGWSVQAGSFGNADNAQRLLNRLSQGGFKAYTLRRDPNTVVLVGPFSSSQAAEETRTQLQQRTGTNGLVVRNGRH